MLSPFALESLTRRSLITEGLLSPYIGFHAPVSQFWASISHRKLPPHRVYSKIDLFPAQRMDNTPGDYQQSDVVSFRGAALTSHI